MKPFEVSVKILQIATGIENSRNPRSDLVVQDLGLLASIIGKKKKKIPKSKKRGKCVFPHNSSKVKDSKDHFPINSESQARNALSRVNQYDESPPWYDGSLTELVKAVAREVKSKYPDIEVSEDSKRPGKSKSKKESSMKPSEVSGVLNQIASAIDNSRNPSPGLVSRDLKKIIRRLATPYSGGFTIVHIWGDESGIYAEDSTVVPPDGKFLDIGLPNSYDRLFVGDNSTLKDKAFIKENIPAGLYNEYGEAVLSPLGVDWADNDDNWNYT